MPSGWRATGAKEAMARPPNRAGAWACGVLSRAAKKQSPFWCLCGIRPYQGKMADTLDALGISLPSVAEDCAQRHSATSTTPRSSPSSYISCLRRIGLVACPSRAAIVRWARCVFLSCARAISCALVQVWRDTGRPHDLGDRALDLLVDHRSFVHLDVVSTARTTRVRGLWGGVARVEWRKGEDQHIGHRPPCLLCGRVVCRP